MLNQHPKETWLASCLDFDTYLLKTPTKTHKNLNDIVPYLINISGVFVYIQMIDMYIYNIYI